MVHGQHDCHSFEEITGNDEREQEGLSGLLLLEAEGATGSQAFRMPPLLQDLGRKLIVFFTLLATGSA
jgi:hypothetical protein